MPRDGSLTLRQVALDALESTDWLVPDAVAALVKQIQKSRPLRDQLTAPLLERACTDYVEELHRHHRADVWSAATPAGKDNPGRIHALAAGNLLTFRLAGGLPVANADRDDLRENSNRYLKQGRTMLHIGRWLRLTAEKVPEGKTVGQVLSAEDLQALKEKAERGDE